MAGGITSEALGLLVEVAFGAYLRRGFDTTKIDKHPLKGTASRERTRGHSWRQVSSGTPAANAAAVTYTGSPAVGWVS